MNMSPNAAHQSHWEISEVVFGIPLVVSIILGVIVPFPIAHGLWKWILLAVGIVLLVLSVAIITAARRELARHGQPTDPGKPTSQIVTTGIFSVSRNPLYLGVVILIIGLSLAINGWWVLIMLVLELVLCHIILIFPEERYLASTFGEEYEAYKRSVNRWLGRSSTK